MRTGPPSTGPLKPPRSTSRPGRRAGTTAATRIRRYANVLIDRYGDDALIEAALRGVKLLKKGEIDGYLLWEEIVKAIEEIQREGATRERGRRLQTSGRRGRTGRG